MKNSKFYAVVVLMSILCAVNVNAQDKNNQSMNSTDAAIIASLGNIHFPCYDVQLIPDEQGYLAEKKVTGHSGLKLGAFFGYNHISGTSANWPDQSANSYSFGIEGTFNYHKKNWWLEPMVRVAAEANSKVNLEDQDDKALAATLELYAGINPCGKFRGYIGYGADYIHSTSLTVIDNEEIEAKIPWAGNALAHGPRIRLEADILPIKTKKMDRGVKVTKVRYMSIVLTGKYQWYEVNEPLGSTFKLQRYGVSVGAAVPLFF